MPRLACLTGILLALALPATAAASGWPLYGGDPARTGLQTDDGAPPLSPLFASAQSAKAVTSPVVTTGRGVDGLARVAFGTGDGHLHVLRLVAGGAAVSDVAVDDGAAQPDTFTGAGSVGALKGQGVTPVDTSTSAGLGNFLVVHNDEGAIQIAQVLEETGIKPGPDYVVPGTTGYTISSSPTITAPDAGGNRVLFFVAFKPCDQLPVPIVPCDPTGDPDDWELFRVPVTGAAGPAPQYGPVTHVTLDTANDLASPTIVTLGDAGGNPVPYVAVSTNSTATVQTFRASDLATGPRSGDLGDTGMSVSAVGDVLYVAVGQDTDASTKVFRLGHVNGAGTLDTTDSSNTIDGSPSVALALSATKVVVTTGKNLAMLTQGDLKAGQRLRFADDLTPGTTGFSQTTAAVMQTVAYVARDDGEPLALSIADAQPLPANQFTAQNGETSTSAWGQPAPADGAVVFGSGSGVYGYDTTVPEAPVVAAAPLSVQESGGVAHVVVAMNQASRRAVTVGYHTTDGSASAGSDFTAVSGTLEFPRGQTRATIDVPVADDPVDESDETFSIVLSDPQNARVGGDGTATATIVDDDTARVLIEDASASEGSSGLKPLGFRVHLTAPSSRLIRVGYATADDTAHGGDDYDPVLGEVRFEPGQTERTISVAIHGDRDAERTERFRVDLLPVEAADLARTSAVGTITDDDTAAAPKDKRKRLRALLVELTPLIDRTRPYRFTVSGRLVPPKKMSRRAACAGSVQLTLSAGARALAFERARVNRKTCRFHGTLRLAKLPKGLRAQALRATARFTGNKRLQPLQSPSLLARLR